MSRVALITGGTKGIGEEICKAFKKKGYIVVATYAHNDDTAQKFKQETGIEVFKWDVANYDQCISGVTKVQEKLNQCSP